MVKGRSARGVSVDFDALKIKEQLVERPAPVEVQAREDFVDQRLKRRAKRRAQEAARKEQNKTQVEADDSEKQQVDEADSLLDEKDEAASDETVEPATDELDTTEEKPVRKQRAPKRKDS